MAYGRSGGKEQVEENVAVSRVIYYWARKHDVMLMLLIYGKNHQDDLTSEQEAVLRKLIQEEYP